MRSKEYSSTWSRRALFPIFSRRCRESEDDESPIRAKAREMLDKLWRGRGGFVAGYYPDNASIGLEPKWQEIAGDEFAKSGKHVA